MKTAQQHLNKILQRIAFSAQDLPILRRASMLNHFDNSLKLNARFSIILVETVNDMRCADCQLDKRYDLLQHTGLSIGGMMLSIDVWSRRQFITIITVYDHHDHSIIMRFNNRYHWIEYRSTSATMERLHQANHRMLLE